MLRAIQMHLSLFTYFPVPRWHSFLLQFFTFLLLTRRLPFLLLFSFLHFSSLNLASLIPAYLPTPWSRVLLEKPTGSQLIKKFLTFFGTRKIITAFTSAHHLIPATLFIFPPPPCGNFMLLQPDWFIYCS